MTTRASGAWSSPPSPRPIAIGTNPSIVAIEVIRIGRSRVRAPHLYRLAERQPVASPQRCVVLRRSPTGPNV